MTGEPFGYWWKFSKYEWKGDHIGPALGATLDKYNPSEQVEDQVKKGKRGRTLRRPYQALLDLADGSRTWQALSLSNEGRSRVLDWCSKNGLLGLFLLDVRQVTLYPRWEAPDSRSDAKPAATLRQFIREPDTWSVQRTASSTMETRLLPTDQKPVGDLVPRHYWDSRWQLPGVLIEDVKHGSGFSTQSLSSVMPQDFPSVPSSESETFAYPRPASPEFWNLYAEDGDSFVDTIQWFSNILNVLGRMKPASELSEDAQESINRACDALQLLVARVNAAIYTRLDGTFLHQCVPTSLISSFAMMALLDAANEFLKVCDNCDKVFTSSAAKARFCSPRCRNAFQRREWRARKRNGNSGKPPN